MDPMQKQKIAFMQKMCTGQGYEYRLKYDAEPDEEYLEYLRQHMQESKKQYEEQTAISETRQLLTKFIEHGPRSFGTSEAMYLLLYCKLSLATDFDSQTWSDLCNNLIGNEYLPDGYRQLLIEYSKIENPTIEILETFN